MPGEKARSVALTQRFLHNAWARNAVALISCAAARLGLAQSFSDRGAESTTQVSPTGPQRSVRDRARGVLVGRSPPILVARTLPLHCTAPALTVRRIK